MIVGSLMINKVMGEIMDRVYLGKLGIHVMNWLSNFARKASERFFLTKRYGDKVCLIPKRELKYLYHITECLCRLNDEIGVVYDIGANKGIWSEAFALYTGNQVFAFEPIESMIEELKKRSSRNPGINIEPVALGEKCYETTINRDINKIEASSILKMTSFCKREFAASGLGNSLKEKIKVVSLDDYVASKQLPLPNLIKIDIQGYELKAIEGGVRTLKTTKYVWIELCIKQLYENGSTFHPVYSLLYSIGFELIDCVELVRNNKTNQLLYLDGIFRNVNL